jgi:squalene monooxygenase
MSLYSVFAAKTPEMMVIQKGCFEYFNLGGDCKSGPIQLMAGMTQSPLVLVYHFFRVALYAIFIMFKDGGVGQLIPNMFRAVAVFYTACYTILPFLWGEMKG